MMRTDDMEALAVAEALRQVAEAATDEAAPGSLRCMVDEEMLRSFAAGGPRSVDVEVNGADVGTYAVICEDGGRGHRVAVEDEGRFLDWCLRNGLADSRQEYSVSGGGRAWTERESDAFRLLVQSGVIGERTVVTTAAPVRQVASRAYGLTGELPDGCRLEEAAGPGDACGTVLDVDAALVARALAGGGARTAVGRLVRAYAS